MTAVVRPVAVIGDCLLDVSIRPGAPIARGTDVPAAIRLSAGGSAANVAVRLARLGIGTRLIAPFALDPAGALVAATVGAEGVDVIRLPAEQSGTVAILVSGDGERTMLSQRVPFPGVAATLIADGVRDARWIHVSAYALLDPQGARIAEVLAERAPETPLAIGLCPLDSPASALLRERAAAARPAIVFANAAEALALLGVAPRADRPDARHLAARLTRELGCVTVVTTAREVAGALSRREVVSALAVGAPKTPVDTTGAGDAVAAAVTAELVWQAGWPPARDVLERALGRAASLAAKAVAAMGAQAPASEPERRSVPAGTS